MRQLLALPGLGWGGVVWGRQGLFCGLFPASLGRAGCIFQHFQGALLMPAGHLDALRMASPPSVSPQPRGVSSKNRPNAQDNRKNRLENGRGMFFSVVVLPWAVPPKNRAHSSSIDGELCRHILEASVLKEGCSPTGSPPSLCPGNVSLHLRRQGPGRCT